MTTCPSTVTIHMVGSLDGFIAREDGSVDWMETADEFPGGVEITPEVVAEFSKSVGCYVMGSRTYETALGFAAKGHGWAYGDTPTFVLTRRALPKARDTVQFFAGDLRELVDQRLRPRFASIWVVGGGAVCGECLQLGLADEVRYSILPVAIGAGIRFFGCLARDVALHLMEVQTYRSGMVEMRYAVRR